MEPGYESSHCIYVTVPCNDCPFETCKEDYLRRESMVAFERRKLFRGLKDKGWSTRMIGDMCNQSRRWVRSRIFEVKCLKDCGEDGYSPDKGNYDNNYRPEH